tara:strand:+ start:177 stop:1274 length:1098 start_codon:yes stop_codon:yes gene_type:complete
LEGAGDLGKCLEITFNYSIKGDSEMTDIIIGLYHFPHVNFFKESIKRLEKKGYSCKIFLRERANLLSTAKFELERDDIDVIGKHRSSNLGKVFEFIKSFLLLLLYIRIHRPKVVASIGGQEVCLVSYIFGIKAFSFNDDPGHGLVFNMTKKFATKIIMPSSIKFESENRLSYNSYKELAHLHPSVFSPNAEVLKEYGLSKYSYILFREQDSISMVYRNVSVGDFREVVNSLGKKTDIVFSLESKDNLSFYESRGIILEEPVPFFHSLVAYASLVITTGDTLAREASLLGTPAIYSGGRDMPVNHKLIANGLIHKIDDISRIPAFIKIMNNNKYSRKYKKSASEFVKKCEDTSEFIVKQLMGEIVA